MPSQASGVYPYGETGVYFVVFSSKQTRSGYPPTKTTVSIRTLKVPHTCGKEGKEGKKTTERLAGREVEASTEIVKDKVCGAACVGAHTSKL